MKHAITKSAMGLFIVLIICSVAACKSTTTSPSDSLPAKGTGTMTFNGQTYTSLMIRQLKDTITNRDGAIVDMLEIDASNATDTLQMFFYNIPEAASGSRTLKTLEFDSMIVIDGPNAAHKTDFMSAQVLTIPKSAKDLSELKVYATSGQASFTKLAASSAEASGTMLFSDDKSLKVSFSMRVSY